jgi:hypothetical protein
MNKIPWLVAGWWFGTMEFYDVPYIGNVIIPIDFHIFQRGRSTTNQKIPWLIVYYRDFCYLIYWGL